MTLNGVIALFFVISANSGSFRAHCLKVHVRYLISWWVLVLYIERTVHTPSVSQSTYCLLFQKVDTLRPGCPFLSVFSCSLYLLVISTYSQVRHAGAFLRCCDICDQLRTCLWPDIVMEFGFNKSVRLHSAWNNKKVVVSNALMNFIHHTATA